MNIRNFYRLLLLILGFSLSANSQGAGIAVFKEQSFHSDASAKAVVYTELVNEGGPFVKIVQNGARSTIDRGKFVANIEVLSKLPKQITTEDEVAPLRLHLKDLNNFSEKFPKSSQMLKGHIDSIGSQIKRFDGSEVRVGGIWITRDAYAAQKKSQRESEEFMQIKQLEREKEYESERAEEERFANQQRIKGLELYDQKWLPKNQVKMLLKRDNENIRAWDLCRKKSISKANYSIFQSSNGHLLIRIDTNLSGIEELAHLSDNLEGLVAENDYYRDTLFWCGTYTYETVAGLPKTVNSYSSNRDNAISLIRKNLISPGSGGSANKPEIVSSEKNDEAGIPEPLRGISASGSGFFVGSNGYFITNAHVVKDAQKVVVFHGGIKLDSTLILVDEDNDLALLKVEKKVKGITLARRSAVLGQDVFTIGFPQPLIQGLSPKMTKGIISSIKGMRDEDRVFQVDSAIQPGNSGGPLCDSSGNLLGVVVSKLDEMKTAQVTGSISQNVNYAIKADLVTKLLKSKNIDFDVCSDTEVETKTRLDAATQASAMVLIW